MLTIPNVDRKLRIDAIIKGFILGLIMTAFSIFSFYFITALTEKMDLIVAGPYIFSIILPIVVTVLFALNMRKKIGGFWTFRQAVTGIFMMFLISYAIVSIGRDLIFGKLIEPNMAQKTEVVMIKVRSQALKSSGASDKEINNQLVELRKEFDTQKKPGIMAVVQNYIINIIMLFVLAIIFAAIFKKEPPYLVKETIIIEE